MTRQAHAFKGVYVEDDPDDQLLFQKTMAEAGLAETFHCVNSAEELFEYLNQQGSPLPNVILLDIHLPQMDGFEAFEKIRNDPSLRGIPVILLTGSRTYLDFIQSLHGGLEASRILCKPLNIEGLLSILKSFGYCLAKNEVECASFPECLSEENAP